MKVMIRIAAEVRSFCRRPSSLSVVIVLLFPVSPPMAEYEQLQKLALSDQTQDEAVTVNQRALIGKNHRPWQAR